MKNILLTVLLVLSATTSFAETAQPKYDQYDTSIEAFGAGQPIKDKLNMAFAPKLGNFEDRLRRVRSVSMILGELNEQQLLLVRNFLGLPPNLTAQESKKVLMDQWRHSNRGSDADVFKYEAAIGRALIDKGVY